MHTSLTMAFWHSSHFNSPESITCPYWGRKDWARICPKLKHNRREPPQAAQGVRLQLPLVISLQLLGHLTLAPRHRQAVIWNPHLNSGASPSLYQSAKDADPGTQQLKLQHGFWCTLRGWCHRKLLIHLDSAACWLSRPASIAGPGVSGEPCVA